MTSGKSKKLRNTSIILSAAFAVAAVVFFIIAGSMQKNADVLRESGYSIFGQVQAQIDSYEMFSTCYRVLAIIFAACAVIYAVLIFGIYYRTQITIADDGSVSGVAAVGIRRKAFSAQASEIEIPNTNGKNFLAFNIKGVRYSVYTDDASIFCKKLVDISHK